MKKKFLFLNRRKRCAFSLIEVVMAMGVATFCLLTLVALIPTGLKSDRESLGESQAVNILSAIVSERRALPVDSDGIVYDLPKLKGITEPTGSFFGIDSAGVSTKTELSQATYKLTYTIIPPATSSRDPYLIHLRLSWPANAATGVPVSSLETMATIPQS
jgi:uncharacterized protein (TIGR02598 family)